MNRILLVSVVIQIHGSLCRCSIICPFNVLRSCWTDSEREVALWRLGVFVASSIKAFKANCRLQACWYEMKHPVFSCVGVPKEDEWWTELHRWGVILVLPTIWRVMHQRHWKVRQVGPSDRVALSRFVVRCTITKTVAFGISVFCVPFYRTHCGGNSYRMPIVL